MSLALAREETLQQPLPGQEPLVLVADPIAEEGLKIHVETRQGEPLDFPVDARE